jgi:hypothetical protein
MHSGDTEKSQVKKKGVTLEKSKLRTFNYM